MLTAETIARFTFLCRFCRKPIQADPRYVQQHGNKAMGYCYCPDCGKYMWLLSEYQGVDDAAQDS